MGLAHRSILISDRSSVGEARRVAVQAAHSLHLNDETRSNVGIVATEAANNMLLHAQSGEFLVCPVRAGDEVWLDLIAIDSGPGIKDIGRAMEDGFSTVGTAGQGLGAIQRLSGSSSLFSAPGKGTAYWSRFHEGPARHAAVHGAVCIPLKGETVAGDAFLILEAGGRSIYTLVDGLGHGSGAAEAAEAAVTAVQLYGGEAVSEIVVRTHDALKGTRGAAIFLAIVDHRTSSVSYGGIGNIGALLIAGAEPKSLISQNGTLGAVLPKNVQEHTLPLPSKSMLVLYSDGLTSKASPAGYAGFQNRHPALLAGLLYRDFSRRRDDASALIVSLQGEPR